MITLLNDTPLNIVAFRAVGKIEKSDYDTVVIPAIDALLKRQDKINFMMIFDTGLSNVSIATIVTDLGTWFKHFTKWHKMAIVSESSAFNSFNNFISHISPGEIKGFTHAEIEQAKQWVSS